MYLTKIFLLFVTLGQTVCDKWMYFPQTRSYYYVKRGFSKLNFTQAEEFCIAFGGHLASIHSEEEDKFITELAAKTIPRKSDFSTLWFGLHRDISSNEFYWTDGTPYDYRKWMKNEPNNLNGTEHCAFLGVPASSDNASFWNDIACTGQNFYQICKTPDDAPYLSNIFTERYGKISTITSTSSATDGIQSSKFIYYLVVGVSVFLVIIIILILAFLYCISYRFRSRNKASPHKKLPTIPQPQLPWYEYEQCQDTLVPLPLKIALENWYDKISYPELDIQSLSSLYDEISIYTELDKDASSIYYSESSRTQLNRVVNLH